VALKELISSISLFGFVKKGRLKSRRG